MESKFLARHIAPEYYLFTPKIIEPMGCQLRTTDSVSVGLSLDHEQTSCLWKTAVFARLAWLLMSVVSPPAGCWPARAGRNRRWSRIYDKICACTSVIVAGASRGFGKASPGWVRRQGCSGSR